MQREYLMKNIRWGQSIYLNKQYSQVLTGQLKKDITSPSLLQ